MAKPEDELNDLLEREGGRPMSDGDLKFVESVATQVKAGRPISPKQAEVISNIWDRYCR